MIDDFHESPYEFLSNFYPAEVSVGSLAFSCVEVAYVASKTTDLSLRAKIQLITRPGVAKRLGRRIRLRQNWEFIKDEVMLDLIRQKFFLHAELAKKLLATGGHILVEGNTWGDRYWGCTRRKDGKWTGRNKLGIILMKVREELRSRDGNSVGLGRETDGSGE